MEPIFLWLILCFFGFTKPVFSVPVDSPGAGNGEQTSPALYDKHGVLIKSGDMVIMSGELVPPNLQGTVGKFEANKGNGNVDISCLYWEDKRSRTLSLKRNRLVLEVVDVGNSMQLKQGDLAVYTGLSAKLAASDKRYKVGTVTSFVDQKMCTIRYAPCGQVHHEVAVKFDDKILLHPEDDIKNNIALITRTNREPTRKGSESDCANGHWGEAGKGPKEVLGTGRTADR